MTDLVYDALTMGVDMIISAVILSSIITLLSSTIQLNSIQAMQTANADMMNYYKEYNQFDRSCVNSSDVLGAVIYYRGTLELLIFGYDGDKLYVARDGKMFYWMDGEDESTKVECTEEKLREFISVNRFYDSRLVEDDYRVYESAAIPPTADFYQGGSITGLVFNQLEGLPTPTPTPLPTVAPTPTTTAYNTVAPTERADDNDDTIIELPFVPACSSKEVRPA